MLIACLELFSAGRVTAQSGGYLWLNSNVNGTTNTFEKIDPASGAIVQTITGSSSGSALPLGGKFAYGGGYLWLYSNVNGTTNTFEKIDPASGIIVLTITGSSGGTALPLGGNFAYGAGYLWLNSNVNGRTNTFEKIDPASGVIVQTITGSSSGTALPLGGEFAVETRWTVTISPSPSLGGSVIGGGTAGDWTTATVTATAASGYNFSNWTQGGTVVSTSAKYQFTVKGNTALVANFTPITYTITTSSSPTTGGSTGGAGTFGYHSSVAVTATPNTGYTFVNWTEGGTAVSTTASYPFIASANRALVAHFTPNTYTVTTSSSPTTGGTTTGGGAYTYGSNVTVTATPNAGYTFANWRQGLSVVSTAAIYSFTASANRTLEANFTTPIYTTVDGLKYAVLNGQIAIMGYVGSATALSIPGTINPGTGNLPVTSIGERAFFANSSLISVAIGTGVTSIGIDAFAHSKLTGVTIPNSVTSIGAGAFYSCTKLTAITVDATNPNYSSSADGVLFDKSQTSLVQCPSGKTGNYTIPDSVTSIGNNAFGICRNLTAITIPNSVTSIGNDAFESCWGLTSVTMGNSVTSIGYQAFISCTGLTSITIPNSVTTIGNQAFYGCTGLTGVTIGTGVTSIGDQAFYGCSGLASVTIPNSVTSIGASAFYGTGLTSVTIGTGVTSIGADAFGSCSNLAAIGMPQPNSHFSTINGILFNGNQSVLIQYPEGKVGSYTIPNGVTSIGSNAFAFCYSLTSVVIPNSVTSIGANAFSSCTSLTSVTIGTGVTTIGAGVFGGCTGLTSITIPNSVTTIGGGAFSGCRGLPSVSIPNSVTSIGDQAFLGCTGLTNLAISNSVTTIGAGVFASCTGLTSITIPTSVTTIVGSTTISNGQVNGRTTGAFEACTGLTSITIPNKVTTIGNNAFNNCTNLGSALFKGNAPAMGSGVFDNTASGFTVYYYNGATGFTSPTWIDGSGDSFPAVNLGSGPAAFWMNAHAASYNADLTGEPNGDGVSLLMDYALNLDPTRNQSASIPTAVVAGGQMTLTFYGGSAGVTYSVESSTDLQIWDTEGVTISDPDANNFFTATLSTTGPSQFMRLVVSY